METEIRTSPELNPQVAALRCPGCMVSWGAKLKEPKYYLCQLILIDSFFKGILNTEIIFQPVKEGAGA